MKPLTLAELTIELKNALDRPNPVLFLGAGVGRRVGFPDWGQFVTTLGDACRIHNDPLSAQLIDRYVSDGQFIEAASIFKFCKAIPDGERWRILADPFVRTPAPDKIALLVPLVSLGATAILTTNYDHSLHEARTRSGTGWFSPVERGDGTFKSAGFRRDFFIARIHGRAEMPTTMVVDRGDYDALEKDVEYLDFVLEFLRSRSCIFIGFSFVDPAIDHILNLYREKFAPVFNALHCAFIPSGAEQLRDRLHALNIKVLVYDSANQHQDLWKAVRRVHELRSPGVGVGPEDAVVKPPAASLHRFIAFAYAQSLSTLEREPVVRLVQDGVVQQVIGDLGKAATEEAVQAAIQPILRLSPAEAATVVAESVDRLIKVGRLENANGTLFAASAKRDDFEADLLVLAAGVVDRMKVRESVAVAEVDLIAARNVLEAVFLSRAWDLAAQFAGSTAGMPADVSETVTQLVAAELKLRTLSGPGALERGVLHLLNSPDDRESKLLARIGRIAFGLQLVFATPRQALFRHYSLPQRIYLDSNVLMPAITEGHPLQPAYVDAIGRLADAGKNAGFNVQVIVGEQFLNEIISHRRLAINVVRELKLENYENLWRHISFYSAINTNVFIGAYASFVGRDANPVAFLDFLKRAAPYETEDELRQYVGSRGMRTEKMEYYDDFNADFANVFARLRVGYEEMTNEPTPWDLGKPAILVEHEAQQLTRMRLDGREGKRVLFVTADNRLRRALQRVSYLRDLAGLCVSHLGLVALVDVMVGLSGDSRALARLVWAVPKSSEEEAVVDYLVSLALKQYDEALAMEMQDAARRCARESVDIAKHEGLSLFSKDAKGLAATAKFLDRQEDNFFRYMREAIERKEAS